MIIVGMLLVASGSPILMRHVVFILPVQQGCWAKLMFHANVA